MASTSAPPGSWRQGGERRAAHGPPIGDGLLTLRHRRQRTTTGPPPNAAGRPSTRKGTTPPHHRTPPTVSARPPGTGQLSGTGHTQPPRTPVRCTHHHHGSARQAAGGGGSQGKARPPTRPTTRHPPPGTLPAPPGTRQLDRRVPCINMQSNGEAAQLGHRFGFWNATTLSTARSSLVSLPRTSQTGRNLPGTRKDAGQCA